VDAGGRGEDDDMVWGGRWDTGDASDLFEVYIMPPSGLTAASWTLSRVLDLRVYSLIWLCKTLAGSEASPPGRRRYTHELARHPGHETHSSLSIHG
jgi:hypothetical protein